MSGATYSSKHNHGWAWMWFAYTGFLFIQPIFEPTLYVWLGTIAVFAVFLVIFMLYMRVEDYCRSRYWLIGATLVLALITFPWNNGGSCLFVYAAAFLPFCIPSRPRVFALFIAESLLIVAEHYVFRHAPPALQVTWPNTLIAIFLLVLIGGGNTFYAQQRRADSKLRMAHEEIEALAAVAERERIARDLHDVLGHTLSVIVLKAELAKRSIDADPQRAAAEIADVEAIGRTALAEVREAIGGYRARGLNAEIEAARRTLAAAGVTLLSDVAPAETAGLSAAEETVLALALREAVTNIVRHARAQNCRLRFVTQNNRRRLVVEDDGEHPLAREGNGLRGMRERVESLGGTLQVEREHGAQHGTRLLIELPLVTGGPMRAGAVAS
jgi:two-component system sensor histidine kinase DesK